MNIRSIAKYLTVAGTAISFAAFLYAEFFGVTPWDGVSIWGTIFILGCMILSYITCGILEFESVDKRFEEINKKLDELKGDDQK